MERVLYLACLNIPTITRPFAVTNGSRSHSVVRHQSNSAFPAPEGIFEKDVGRHRLLQKLPNATFFAQRSGLIQRTINASKSLTK